MLISKDEHIDYKKMKTKELLSPSDIFMSNESLIFQELKPLCVGLSRIAFQPQEVFNPNSRLLLDALKKLEARLALFTSDVFSQNLADYLFVPISSLLKQKTLGEQQTELVLLIISHLLRLCWRETGSFPEKLSQQLLPLINFLISSDLKDPAVRKKSTDFKNSSACVLQEYFTSLKNQLYCREYFSSEKSSNLSNLGHCITVLLEILESSTQDSSVQLLVLETLSLLYRDILSDGEILSFILPGNVSSFSKLLVKPGLTVNYKVIIKTLETFGILLTLVYDDFSLNVKDNAPVDLQSIVSIGVSNEELNENRRIIDNGMEYACKPSHRNTSWLLATSAQIKLALEGCIPRIIKRNNQQILFALAMFISDILLRCSKSLSNCKYLLLSTLVTLKMDPKHQLAEQSACLIDVIKTYTSRLNHLIQFEDVPEMKSLLFALKMVTQGPFYYEDLMLFDVTSEVVEILEQSNMKNQGRKILEQSSNVFLTENFEASVVQNTRMSLPVFSNISAEMEASLGELFKFIGQISRDQDRLSDLVVSLLSENTTTSLVRKTASLWISAWLIKGFDMQEGTIEAELLDFGDTKERDIAACYRVLEYCDFLAQEIIFVSEGSLVTREVEAATCAVLFSLETACSVLGEDFKYELIDHIYTVIENLASSSPVVREFAQSCALLIAQNFYQDSIKTLILDNIDYLAESISARLNLGLTERVSTVLTVVAKIAGYETIENFKDIFETIFKLIDYYHGYDEMCLQFFQLFEILVLEMKKKYFPPDIRQLQICDGNDMRSSYLPWGMTNLQQVVSLLDKGTTKEDKNAGDSTYLDDENGPKNFQQFFDSKIREADSDDEDDDEGDFHENKPIDERVEGTDKVEWLSPIPVVSYRVLLQIFNYGDRLLTHKSKALRIQILRVMRLTIPLLASQYDSLLPQIAQSWQMVVECTLDTDLTIIRYSCDCLRDMIRYSKDFITKRFLELWTTWRKNSTLLEELHPSLWDAVQNNANKSLTHSCRRLPPAVHKALVSMCNVQLEGISVTGLMLSDATLKEMIYSCLQVLPAKTISDQSIVAADVVYVITHEVA